MAILLRTMAYDPGADSRPSPVQVGELYSAVRDWALTSGTMTLGNPDAPPPQKPNGVDFSQNMFYGFPNYQEGDVMVLGGDHPLASHPPTWRARYTDLTPLLDEMPDLPEIIGLGATMDVRYHAPYVSYNGDASNLAELLDARPVPEDCAIVLHGPLMAGIKKRIYKFMPNPDNGKYARSPRTDQLFDGTIRREATGMLPEIATQEWERLTRIAAAAGSLFTADHPLIKD